jgi:hypothetical protein
MSIKSVLCVACAVGLMAACSSPKEAASKSGSAPAASAGTAASTGTLDVAAGDFGVPECDSYMKKYLACVDSKVPDAVRGTLKQAFDQQKTAWKQAASTPQGKAALATGCAQAEAAAKQSMAAYGCQW